MNADHLSLPGLPGRFYLGTLLACLLLLGACSKKQGNSRYIPKETGFVAAVDMQRLATKSLNLKDLFSLDVFRQRGKKSTTESTRLAERLQNAGINWLGTAYIFGNPTDSLKNPEVTLLIPLGDARQFEEFLKKEQGRIDPEKGDLHFFSNDSLTVGWDEATAFVTQNRQASPETIKKRLVMLKAMPASYSLAENNDYFDKMRGKSFDVLLWADLSRMKTSFPTPPLPGVAALKPNYLGALLNFEKGEMVFDGQVINDNPALDKYPGLMRDKVKGNVVSRIPIRSPVATFALNVNLGTVKQMLKDNNVMGTANQTVQMLGMTAEEVLDMLSGELAVSVINLPDTSRALPDMFVSLGVRNQGAMKKLISNFKNQGFLVDEGKYISFVPMPSLTLVNEGDKLLVATSSGLRTATLAKGGEKLNEEATASLKNGAFSCYVDYNTLADKLPVRKDSGESELIRRYLKAFILNGIQTSANTSDVRFAITLKEKDKNSLVTLVELSKEMKALRTKEAAEQPARASPTLPGCRNSYGFRICTFNRIKLKLYVVSQSLASRE